MTRAQPTETVIILLRHGSAVASHPNGDRERPLAKGARERIRAVARALASHVPTRALISPARRTRETFEAFAEEYGTIDVEMDEAIYNASLDTLLSLPALSAGGTALLIGHNPGISATAQAMSGGCYSGIMAPADAVVIAWDPATSTGRLVETLRAAQMPRPD